MGILLTCSLSFPLHQLKDFRELHADPLPFAAGLLLPEVQPVAPSAGYLGLMCSYGRKLGGPVRADVYMEVSVKSCIRLIPVAAVHQDFRHMPATVQ